MTRTITPAEIKPGMRIRFDLEGWDVKGTVARMHRRPQGMWLYTDQSFELSLDLDAPVTVLSEPAPAQPEEPTSAGAKVLAGVHRFLRCGQGVKPWRRVLSNGAVGNLAWSWSEVCSHGPVQVVPDQGWAVPDSPEVPERIEEWPEDDTALRKYKWRDRDDDLWSYKHGKWWWEEALSFEAPIEGPWTRETDA